MNILVKVNGQKLRIPANCKKLVYGTRNFVKFCFSFSQEWGELDKYARFAQGDNVYDVRIDDKNICYLPASTTVGNLVVMVYGVGGDGGEVIGVTNQDVIKIYEAEYTPLGDDPHEVYSDDFVASLSETLEYLNIS